MAQSVRLVVRDSSSGLSRAERHRFEPPSLLDTFYHYYPFTKSVRFFNMSPTYLMETETGISYKKTTINTRLNYNEEVLFVTCFAKTSAYLIIWACKLQLG